MKTIKHILSASLILMLFASCSSDDDGDNQPLQTLLSKRITNSETISYTYDNNNRVISSSSVFSDPMDNVTTTYTYNSSGQLAEVLYDGQTATDTKTVYFFNGNGQLTKVETYLVADAVATLNSTSEAEYSTVGKVSVYQTSFGGTPYLNVEYFLDANGNIESQLSYSPEGFLIVTTENSDFDDKHDSRRSLPQTAFVRNVNNYRTVTTYSPGGSPSVGTFTYEYNSDNYPTKRTSNTGSVVTYEYIER